MSHLATGGAVARAVAAAGVTVALLLVVAPDGALAVAGGALLLALRAVRAFAGGVRFGFADGFIPFRGDLGWPRGVQEDDDFHWSWPAGGGERSSARTDGRHLRNAWQRSTTSRH